MQKMGIGKFNKNLTKEVEIFADLINTLKLNKHKENLESPSL